MKLIKILIASWILASIAGCQSTPNLKPETGSVETCGAVDGTQAEYCHTRYVEHPTCTLWYWPGLNEDSHAVTSTKYPHPELPVIAKANQCDVAVLGWGKAYMIGADLKPIIGSQSPVLSKVQTAMDFVEKKHALSTKRLGMGVSEGGFNLVTIAMAKPDTFEKIALVHPVILASDSVNPADALVFLNFSIAKWTESANPKVAIMKVERMPKTYITACKDDSLVGFDGPREWFEKAQSRGFDTTWHQDADGCKHGKPDQAPIAVFLGGVK